MFEEQEKMRSLEELKSIDDGGSFERLVKRMEEIANGDEALKLELLKQSVVQGFVDMHFGKAMGLMLLADEALRMEGNGVEFGFPNFKIPKKIRSTARDFSNVESRNRSWKRCFFEIEEEEEIVKKPAVKKQRKADDSLEEKKKKQRKAGDRSEEKKKRKADDCLEEEKKKKKKQRKADDSLGEKKKKKTIVKKRNLNDQSGLNLPPDLPQEFKDRIERLNGTNIILVAQKELTCTDMDQHQGRFSVARGKVKCYDFLTEEDLNTLFEEGVNNGIQCSLIQPCLEEATNLEFKKWNMGKHTFSFILIKKWNSVAYDPRNRLDSGCMVQLWSFRVGSDLWFALVNLTPEEENATCSTSTAITSI